VKYDWNNLTEEQKRLAVKREMELVTHNGTTKDDFINIMHFLQGIIEAQQQEIEKLTDDFAALNSLYNVENETFTEMVQKEKELLKEIDQKDITLERAKEAIYNNMPYPADSHAYRVLLEALRAIDKALGGTENEKD
jgi:hypothetical protein